MPSGFEIAGKMPTPTEKIGGRFLPFYAVPQAAGCSRLGTRAGVFAGSKRLGARHGWRIVAVTAFPRGIFAPRGGGRAAFGCPQGGYGSGGVSRSVPVRIPIRANARNALACFSGRSIRKAATSCRSGLRRV